MANKEISKAQIVESIKQAYKEGRDWCRQDFGRYYRMMIDTKDGSIWSDVFCRKIIGRYTILTVSNFWSMYQAMSVRQKRDT